MTVYRPAGYGPAPTEEERAAAAALRGMSSSAWLQRRGSSAPCVVFLWPGTETWPDCTYCALGPDGLPCAIGTPPKTEWLYKKFVVERADGRDKPGGDRAGARYIVLDVVHDEPAKRAALAYADALQATHPGLAGDIRDLVFRLSLDWPLPETERERLERAMVDKYDELRAENERLKGQVAVLTAEESAARGAEPGRLSPEATNHLADLLHGVRVWSACPCESCGSCIENIMEPWAKLSDELGHTLATKAK